MTAKYQTPKNGIATIGIKRCAARLISVTRASRSRFMTFTTTHATSPASVIETTVRNKRLGQTLGLSRDVAEEVVSNRPYRLRGELVAKNVIPKVTFDEIKGRITASP